MTKPPVPYAPDVETPEPDEADTSRALREALHDILETTSADYDRAVRSVHAKGHGLIDAELRVHPNLPPEYAQGLFATSGSYPVIMRFSTNPGDILDDSISVPRGLAMKLAGVDGPRLDGAEGATTQDFVMANAPAFAAANAKQFLANLKLLAKTTDRAEWAKKALSAVLRTTEAALEAAGGKSALLTTLGGAPNVHPLGETYYSQTPFRYGDHIAKFALFPASSDLLDLKGQKVDTSGRPDAIREDLNRDMQKAGGTWDLRVQLCRDLETMPIEDASAVWSEEESPFVTVATIVAEPQAGWKDEASVSREETLSFSPWHGLAAHQPLGSINRVRKPAYTMSAEFRAEANGCPIHEPRREELAG